MDPSEKPARKRRIAIVGSRGVDKSSLITQFVENHFVETYYPTIESTFNKVITYAGVNYDCDLIDTAGQDEYSVLSARNAVNTHAYMLVYSITSRNSLDMAVLVHEKILDFTGLDSFPCVFVGNKCHEHQSRQVSREEGRTRAKERNAAWIETSTKFNENVEAAFSLCVEEIHLAAERERRQQSAPSRSGLLGKIFNSTSEKPQKWLDEDSTLAQKVVSLQSHIYKCVERDKPGEAEDCVIQMRHLFLSLTSETASRDITSKSDSQAILNTLQWLLDYPMNLESQNRGNTKLVHLLLRLSKRYDSYPQCLVLRGVLKSGDQPLAAGHFGEVWKGQFLEQPICLKVVRLYQNSDAHRLIKAFSREAIIWSHLSHDNLLPFYGMYQLEDNSNRICLVSPWMDNGTLREHIGHNPRSNRLWLLSDVASGLAYLHEQSVTHGDLKGQNILVSKFGRACLADFGLSRATEAQTSHWGSGSTTHAVGTVRWQAPELFDPDLDNPKPTAASDVYSFSCVCYEAFTGEIPFYEYPRDATVIAFVTRGRRPTKPSPFSHGLTMDFWTLMEMCWSSEPSKRPIVVQVLQQPVFRELEDNRPEGQAYILSLSQFRRSVYGGSQSGRGLSSWLKW